MAVSALEEGRLYALGYSNVAGVDESGMGTYVGDVYVSAVILPKDIDYKTLLPGLNDSKQKSPEQRVILYEQIKKHAIAYSVATASVAEIDELNIYWARFLAARRALSALSVSPDYVIIDGNHDIPEITIPQHAIIKGDAKSISIAAASILAKVERDRYMDELSKSVHPDYGLDENRGYYCPKTVNALKKHGKTQWHRKKYVENFFKKVNNEKVL